MYSNTIGNNIRISGGKDPYSIFKVKEAEVKKENNKDNDFIVERGDIFEIDLGNDIVGSEQSGIRPVTIVQNDVGNKKSSTIIVAVLTSKNKNAKNYIPTHVEIIKDDFNNLKLDSMVLLEQLRTVDKKRLKRKIGFLKNADMERVDEALDISVHNKRKNNFSTDEKREQNEVFDISRARDYADQVRGLDEIINKLDNQMVYTIKRSRNTLFNELRRYCNKYNQSVDLFYKIVFKNNNYKEMTAINA